MPKEFLCVIYRYRNCQKLQWNLMGQRQMEVGHHWPKAGGSETESVEAL